MPVCQMADDVTAEIILIIAEFLLLKTKFQNIRKPVVSVLAGHLSKAEKIFGTLPEKLRVCGEY